MSRSKAKGTAFETMVARYLRERLGQPGIERRALRGGYDAGDLFGIGAHGFSGIAECKNHASYGPSDVDKWRGQTVAERENSGADFALLVIHKAGCGAKRVGDNICQMQVRDLAKVMDGKVLAGDGALDMWVTVSLGDAVDLMGR